MNVLGVVVIRSITSVVIVTGLMIGGVLALVWFGGGTQTALPHLMYLPLIFAATRLGTGGGVAAAIVSGVSMGFIPVVVGAGGESQPLASVAVRTLAFTVAAATVGRSVGALRRRSQEVEDSFIQSVTALVSTIEANHQYTAGHSAQVSRISRLLGDELRLPEDQLTALTTGALLHDIGKVSIDQLILDKPGRLTDDEYEAVKRHTVVGDMILSSFKHRSAPIIRDIVRHHHERLDGSGYPDRLAGAQISLAARITAVADVYEAMTSDRPYRKGMTQEEALGIIQREVAAGRFDPDVVRALVRLVEEGLV